MNVQGPDGKIIAFPDSMSESDINSAMQGLYPQVVPAPPSAPAAAPAPPTALSPWARVPLGLLAAGGSGLLQGGETLGNVIHSAIDPLQQTMGPLEARYGLTENTPSVDPYGVAAALHNQLTGPLAPQSEPERLGQATVSGLASAVPLALTAGGGLPVILAGGSGGAAAEGARAAGAPVPLQIAAGLAAGGATAIAQPAARTIAQIARDLGTSGDVEAAGNVLQPWAENWRANVLPSELARAEAPMVAAVPAGAVVQPSELVSRAQDLLQRGGAAANATRDFLRATAASGGNLGNTAKALQGPLTGTTGLPALAWDESRAFRTELGNTLRSAQPADKPALQYLYGGATQDLGTTAAAHGAGDLFQQFNTASTNLHALDSGPVEDLISRSPGAGAARLLGQGRQDGSALQALRDAGAPVDELAAGHLASAADGRGFTRLAPGAQAALVPDAGDRAIIAASVPAKGSSTLGNRMGSLLGSHLGGAGARLIGSVATPAVSPLITEAAGELFGSALPSIIRRIGAGVKNPLLPAAGAQGASANNALMP